MDKHDLWIKIIAAIALIALVSASLFSLLYYLFV